MIGCCLIGYEYVGQGYSIPAYSHLDPDHWLTSLMRTLKWYVGRELDPSIWDIRFEFPAASDFGEEMPLPKSIIHFDIDNIQNPYLGFGNAVVQIYKDPISQELVTYEGLPHTVNLDVGVWASDRSGGVTSRLVAYELLSNLFNGAGAYNNLTGLGIEIQSFGGGEFVKEEINNVSIYRISGMTLELRLYSRRITQYIPFVVSGFTIDQQLEDSDGVLIPNQN